MIATYIFHYIQGTDMSFVDIIFQVDFQIPVYTLKHEVLKIKEENNNNKINWKITWDKWLILVKVD